MRARKLFTPACLMLALAAVGCAKSDTRSPVEPDPRPFEPAGQASNALVGRWVHISTEGQSNTHVPGFLTETVYEFNTDFSAIRTVRVRTAAGQVISTETAPARWGTSGNLLSIEFGAPFQRTMRVAYFIRYGVDGTRLELDGLTFLRGA